MNIERLIESEITVVVDDYDTGEVIYEGKLQRGLYDPPLVNGYVLGIEGYPKSIEWMLKDGRPVALVTIELGEDLAMLKRFLAARAAYDIFMAEPVYKGLSRDERKRLSEQRWPEQKRLWHELCVAQSEFEGWELIEE